MTDTEPNIMELDIPLRSMQCELNVLTRSDGSAILAQGDFFIPYQINSQMSNKYLFLVAEISLIFYINVNNAFI